MTRCHSRVGTHRLPTRKYPGKFESAQKICPPESAYETYWQLVVGFVQYGTLLKLKTSGLRVSMVRRSHSAGAVVEPSTVMRCRFGTALVPWITPVELVGSAERAVGAVDPRIAVEQQHRLAERNTQVRELPHQRGVGG